MKRSSVIALLSSPSEVIFFSPPLSLLFSFYFIFFGPSRRSIRCLRNIIHWNLITAFILRNATWFIVQLTMSPEVHESNVVRVTCWSLITCTENLMVNKSHEKIDSSSECIQLGLRVYPGQIVSFSSKNLNKIKHFHNLDNYYRWLQNNIWHVSMNNRQTGPSSYDQLGLHKKTTWLGLGKHWCLHDTHTTWVTQHT